MHQPISIVNIYYQGFGDKRLIGKLTMDGDALPLAMMRRGCLRNQVIRDMKANINWMANQ